ncbi:MAG TPA: hypothetical protein P5548_01430 [Candidatus Moranbacteria bacterium]|nr:hypothetical protein [Candidatus Moranbacteria bacterium]HRZ33551.1 hypothetical protein [Candidatus Moranbacteria bacterium]
MEIKNKLLFKTEVKKKIDRFIKEFPIYFFINIVINISLIVMILGSAFFVAFSLEMLGTGIHAYIILFIAFLSLVFRITIKGFFRNIKILKSIQAGDYEFGIENHELDNAIEFIEDMPIKKDEVEKMRVALSFNKLIDVLEYARIIKCSKGLYDVDLVFKYRVEKVIEDCIKM